MNWYKKDTRPNLLLAHDDNGGEVFAQLLKNSLVSQDHTIDLISTSRAANFKPAYGQSLICTDLESTLEFCNVPGNVCLFFESPYEVIENSATSVAEKKEILSRLHDSISKVKRVIALSDTCRANIQQFHEKHIYVSHLPATHSDLITALPAEGIATIVNDHELHFCDDLLANLEQLNSCTYLTPSDTRVKVDTPAMRLPSAGLVPLRPMIQIYLGADNSESPPLRIIDAAAAGSVVVQIAFEGQNWTRGRRMPTNCIGYFNLERQDADISELTAFIAHLQSNQMFFDSVLAAQRRYLPNYQSNRNHFFELLTK